MLLRIAEHAGHLAVWAGAYVVGALIAAALIAGEAAFGSRPPDLLALWCAFATGVSVYLVDRVKLADRWLDPADAQAHPERWTFLHPHRWRIRLVALLAGLSAVACAAWLAWWLIPVILGAYVGVFAYAGRSPGPERRRLKDMLIVKNVCVGVSIAALSVLFLGASRDVSNNTLVIAGLVLISVVFSDAALCDLDDVASDAAFGTRTIPVVTSKRLTWLVAGATQTLALIGALAWRPSQGVVIFSIGMVVTTALLRIASPDRVRDLIDARLALVGGLALLWSSLG